MNRVRFGAAALLTALIAATAASAAERTLALEVVMNGRSTGRVGEIIDRGGALYATPTELTALGFMLPHDTVGADPIPLASLANVHAQVDEAAQTLVVQAADSALLPTELGGGLSGVALAPLSPSGYGAVLDYDLSGTQTLQESSGGGRSVAGGALLDMRAFSPFGVVQATGLTNFMPSAGQASVVRLSTTYSHAQPDDLRRWNAGDVVTGALSWSRAVRLGGAQLSSDFGLRPDLITYPLPVISASAALPSTVDVLVNGIHQITEPVDPGPFAVRSLPVVTGAGDIAVTVVDALGRQTLVTLPFYASAALLRPGLASYSLEAGAVRQNYGLINDRYAGSAASGSLRYGVTDWLTLESHAEGTAELGVLGAGAVMKLFSLGVVSAALSGSNTRGAVPEDAGGSSGGQVSAGFRRTSRSLSFNVSGTYATGGYRDIAAVNGAPVPKTTINASVGYQFGRWGSLGAGYVSQVAGRQLPGLSYRSAFDSIGGTRTSLGTLSYNVPIAGGASFYVTGFRDLRDAHSYGVGFGVSIALGPTTSASAGGSVDNGRASSTLSIGRSAQSENDYGYEVQDQEGFAAQRQAEGEYLSPWGRLTIAAAQSPGQAAVRGGVSGAVVVADGHVFASDRIYDSFAVVDTGGVAGVPVLYENRLVGISDSSGRLLVPSLLSFQNNQLSVDATRLPADIEVGQTSVLVRPSDRSGSVVDFHVRKVHAAVVTLVDNSGKPLPLGSIAKIAREEDKPVGYDGQAYVTGLQSTNLMEVVLPDGKSCSAQFEYQAVAGDIPLIGPVRCQ